MAQNPLLGKRISLISKKNIRYEGVLYSINESDATVALQNVRSYGTEGREELDPGTNPVPPQDTVHDYLLFRGQDIKDLHVHESAETTAAPEDPSIISTEAPPEAKPEEKTSNKTESRPKQPNDGADSSKEKKPTDEGKGEKSKRTRKQKSDHQVGTGASLLTRKARGVVDGGVATPSGDFDFESNLASFAKSDEDYDEEEEPSAYAKDDFFDSISCDALDKQAGIDNRLRGRDERNLNTETFGAVALNSRRGRRYRGSGRGRGRGRGRGGGRGRGPRPRENTRWRREPTDSGRQRSQSSRSSGQSQSARMQSAS